MLQQPFAPPALILLCLALPLIFGLVPPNRLYGIRTARTLGDPRAWFLANRYAGLLFVFSSSLYLLLALLRPYSNPNDFGTWLTHLGAFIGPVLLSLFMTGAYLKRL